MIVGSGRVGSAIAMRMLEEGHEVSVLDEDPEAIAQLEKGIEGTWVDAGGSFTVGTALEMDALLEAGIESADAFVGSTHGGKTKPLIAPNAQKRVDGETAVGGGLGPAR